MSHSTRCRQPYAHNYVLTITHSEVHVCLTKRQSALKRPTRIAVAGDSRTRSFHTTLYTLLTYLPLPSRSKDKKWKIDWKFVDNRNDQVLDLVFKINQLHVLHTIEL